ncbi:CIC11C00000000599 [Sungouiella intermedia]|uniref:CIC11C00000000599 n=1 Tax=Sungouiella intermedia TaxID=45354 RepID=A0A1L0BR36_9ASCO|nr:CIC11C00000000599 [[Candida] intermedia]
MLFRTILPRLAISRAYSSKLSNYFELFPKCFPAGGPPADQFAINLRQLRREYRNVQSEHHPDVIMGSAALSTDSDPTDTTSALVNRAYSTIRNPYTRAAYVIQIHHPEHIDITQDDVSKALISKFQAESPEYSVDYKMLLMTVLDAHESLELAGSEADLESLQTENEARIEETEGAINTLLKKQPIVWEEVIIETIRMKYWVNIANGIKDWEPGKPVHLTH